MGETARSKISFCIRFDQSATVPPRRVPALARRFPSTSLFCRLALDAAWVTRDADPSLLALVSVTATLAQSLLAFLIVALYMAGMVYLSDKIPSSSFSGSSDVLSAVLFVAVSVAIIVLQYARRRTATARWLIVGLGGILLLILAVTPYGSIVANNWPALNEGERPGFDLTLMPARSGATVGFISPEKDEVTIRLPLAGSGIASDEIVRFNGVLVSVGSVHEVDWDSGGRSDGRELFPETRIIE